jgi:peptidyl-prolyl cis-trans isomerase SurA
LQLARDTGLKVDDGAIDQAEQNVARQNEIDVTELRRRLERDGISPASFRAQLRDQLTLSRLREREVEPRVRVTDQDVDQFIQEQKGIGSATDMVLDLGQVLIAVPEGATAAQVAERQARAQQVLARAQAGEDFAKLAREMSDAPGAASDGGQMGSREADRYPALFVDAVKAVPPGGIAALVRSGAGFHVLKVLEKRQADMPGISVTQTRARHILLRVSAQMPESQARERLLDFKKRIETGKADFAELAREFSQDGSARDGGDLGWTNPGMFVPEFEDVLSSLRPGELSAPLVSRFGVHLIQLQERRQAILTEREQREIARNLLREKKLDEAYVEWARDVRGRAYVELRDPPQ